VEGEIEGMLEDGSTVGDVEGHVLGTVVVGISVGFMVRMWQSSEPSAHAHCIDPVSQDNIGCWQYWTDKKCQSLFHGKFPSSGSAIEQHGLPGSNPQESTIVSQRLTYSLPPFGRLSSLVFGSYS